MTTAPGQPMPCQVGSLSFLFDPQLAFVRYVRYGSDELLRGVYAAVRDHNWDTVEPIVENVQVDQKPDRLVIRFDCRCRDERVGADLAWAGRIEADASARLTYTFDGEALTDFRRNRIGFCVLHPREAAGRKCRIEHTDGSVDPGAFPEAISPHQPFMDVRAIEHEASPGLWARVVMQGDTFETEDQRNWTDASFKTYCTPLGLPFPVPVSKGERVSQSVEVSVEAEPTVSVAQPVEASTELSFDGVEPVRLPAIGLEATPGHAHTPDELQALAGLRPAHLRVDLKMSDAAWTNTLSQAVAAAESLGAALEVAAFFPRSIEPPLAELDVALSGSPIDVARLLLFSADQKVTPDQLAADAGARFGQRYRLAVGTDAFFAELNRERPDASHAADVAFTINPQVHAFDERSLIETLGAQVDAVAGARRFAGGRSVVVSPVTLKMRWNPNATGEPAPPPPGQPPHDADPRQLEPFCAVWTLGSVANLATAGAASLTFYQTVGYRGVMEREQGSAYQDWATKPGQMYPVGEALAVVGQFAGGSLTMARSADPLRAGAIRLALGDAAATVVLNYTNQPLRPAMDAWPVDQELPPFGWKVLDR